MHLYIYKMYINKHCFLTCTLNHKSAKNGPVGPFPQNSSRSSPQRLNDPSIIPWTLPFKAAPWISQADQTATARFFGMPQCNVVRRWQSTKIIKNHQKHMDHMAVLAAEHGVCTPQTCHAPNGHHCDTFQKSHNMASWENVHREMGL